ncbi:unnamed protein product [Bathycoccus prasinos]
MIINVSFKNQLHAIHLPSSEGENASTTPTVLDLSEAVLEQLFKQELLLDRKTMKFIGLHPKGMPLQPYANPETDGNVVLDDTFPSIKKGKKVLLVASEVANVEKMKRDEKVDVRVRGFEDEMKREKRRDVRYLSRTSKDAYARAHDTSSNTYTFQSLRVLAVPEGMVEPSREKTMHLLERLKRDPGVVRVMETKRFRVGLLCEMPPEGLVGISETCVLGFNRNNGMEIHLRLRTDDWSGLRRYESIRRVLMHELAHNVISEHNAEFKALNSELVQLCERDWNRGRRVGGSGETHGNDNDGYDSLSEDECMKETRKLSGMKLGGVVGAKPYVGKDPREMAARKALERFEQQQQRQLNTNSDDREMSKMCSCGACDDDGEVKCQPC